MRFCAGLLLMSVGMAAIGVVSGWAASAAAAASAHSSGLEANGDFSSEMQRLVDSAASSSATGSASEGEQRLTACKEKVHAVCDTNMHPVSCCTPPGTTSKQLLLFELVAPTQPLQQCLAETR